MSKLEFSLTVKGEFSVGNFFQSILDFFGLSGKWRKGKWIEGFSLLIGKKTRFILCFWI